MVFPVLCINFKYPVNEYDNIPAVQFIIYSYCSLQNYYQSFLEFSEMPRKNQSSFFRPEMRKKRIFRDEFVTDQEKVVSGDPTVVQNNLKGHKTARGQKEVGSIS